MTSSYQQDVLLFTDNQCFYYGKVYQPGVKFADESCKAWCECNGASGHVVCVSLCPPLLPVPCSPGETAVTMKVKSVDPTGRCMCKRNVCTPSADIPIPPMPPHPGEWSYRFVNKTKENICRRSEFNFLKSNRHFTNMAVVTSRGIITHVVACAGAGLSMVCVLLMRKMKRGGVE